MFEHIASYVNLHVLELPLLPFATKSAEVAHSWKCNHVLLRSSVHLHLLRRPFLLPLFPRLPRLLLLLLPLLPPCA